MAAIVGRAMNDKAAIVGSLVSAKNVGVHKSVALTIHVPEELALRVFEIFGWPTMSHPISVALARLALAADAPADALVPKRRGRPPGSGKGTRITAAADVIGTGLSYKF